MSQQIINVGTNANDNTGDPIRTAFIKTNANFTELYTRAYGAFQSIQTQTCNANTATPMSFEIVDVDDGITIVDNVNISFPNIGVYNIQFSVQTKNTANGSDALYIWLRQNDIDIPGSAGKINVPGTQAGGSGELIVGWNYFIRTTSPGEQLQIVWFVADEVHTTLAAFPAQSATASTPAIPSTASIVLTVNQVG
jgi:hypothetical protein